jgi:hypothetical protein
VLDDRSTPGAARRLFAPPWGTAVERQDLGLPQLNQPAALLLPKGLATTLAGHHRRRLDSGPVLEAAIAATKYEGDKIVQMGSLGRPRPTGVHRRGSLEAVPC